jgi:hypothetical protein
MVAGRGFWGDNEQRAAQHQARRSGDLGVEAVVEDRFGAGETGGLGAGVEACRKVDEKNHGDAEQAEHKDDPTQPPPSLVAQSEEGENAASQRNRNQQEGVSLPGGSRIDGGRAGRRQAGIARLADLDRAVLDELGGDQAGGGGEDGQADRPLWGEQRADPGRRALRPGAAAQQPPFEYGQAAEEENTDGAQTAAEATTSDPRRTPGPDEPGPGTLKLVVDRVVELRGCRPYATPNRCYHRASLRLLFRSSFRRAREGLFHAPIPGVLAGRPRLLRFISSPLHKATLTLRPCHVTSL